MSRFKSLSKFIEAIRIALVRRAAKQHDASIGSLLLDQFFDQLELLSLVAAPVPSRNKWWHSSTMTTSIWGPVVEP